MFISLQVGLQLDLDLYKNDTSGQGPVPFGPKVADSRDSRKSP